MLQGASLSTTNAQKHIFAELEELYEQHLQSNPTRSSVDTIRHIRIWKDFLAQYALSSLTPALIIQTRN